MANSAIRRTGRLLAGGIKSHPSPWQPPQYQVTSITYRTPPYADDFVAQPSWTRVAVGPEAVKARDALPRLQWVSAYEYEQLKGQLDHMESAGITEGHWAKWNEIHYRLVDAADKYLVENPSLDSAVASEVWAKWNLEADEHLAYQGIMTWRYQSFTESNLEVVPPGELREELRYTAPNDLHPDLQEAAFAARQAWLPASYRFNPLPDPMRLSRLHTKNREALLKQVDTVEAEWVAKASTTQEAALVRSYTALWRRAIAPSAHVDVTTIKACTDVPTLQEMFELVFSDNGDDRLYAIAARAAELRADKTAAELAKWCAGVAARDADQAARRVEGVTFSAAPLSAAETAGAELPADFSEIKTAAQLTAWVDFWRAHYARALVVHTPADRATFERAWPAFEAVAAAQLASGAINGAALRFAWWSACAEATPESAYYTAPLLPVRKDANGTRFQLRMIGALNRQGVFGGLAASDPSYVADALSFVNFKALSQAELDEILVEYPGFGVDWKAVPAEAKARVAKAGLKLAQVE